MADWGWLINLSLWRSLAAKSMLRVFARDSNILRFERTSEKAKIWFSIWKCCETMTRTWCYGERAKRSNASNLADLVHLRHWWPVFASDHTNADNYQALLRQHVVPLLNDISWWKMRLLADSAPAYTTKTTQRLLAEFWIPANWLPHVPDLNSLDFYKYMFAGESPGYTTCQSGHPTSVHRSGMGPASDGIYLQDRLCWIDV